MMSSGLYRNALFKMLALKESGQLRTLEYRRLLPTDFWLKRARDSLQSGMFAYAIDYRPAMNSHQARKPKIG